MLLELKNICKSYPQGKEMVPILRDVNLKVDNGEYVAIMGPSGSGKTTLMNIIGCLDRPTSGSYLLEGKEILKYKDKEMSKLRLETIGFVFQSFFLMPGETAAENVCLPLTYAGIPKRKRREIAEKALGKVGLAERVNYKPSQLSGGQCQRVAIARAISNNPKILLADEPTGALDSKSGAQIMELFESLNKEGVTIIMITHDEGIARHAKRVIRILDGQISEKPFLAAQAGGQQSTEEKAKRLTENTEERTDEGKAAVEKKQEAEALNTEANGSVKEAEGGTERKKPEAGECVEEETETVTQDAEAGAKEAEIETEVQETEFSENRKGTEVQETEFSENRSDTKITENRTDAKEDPAEEIHGHEGAGKLPEAPGSSEETARMIAEMRQKMAKLSQMMAKISQKNADTFDEAGKWEEFQAETDWEKKE